MKDLILAFMLFLASGTAFAERLHCTDKLPPYATYSVEFTEDILIVEGVRVPFKSLAVLDGVSVVSEWQDATGTVTLRLLEMFDMRIWNMVIGPVHRVTSFPDAIAHPPNIRYWCLSVPSQVKGKQ